MPSMHWSVRRRSCISRSKTLTAKYRKPTYEPALALGCSRSVIDGHITSLLASSFRITAAQLLLIDLHATYITAVSVITIFQTCPLLQDLDVGECKKLSVVELARRLEEVPHEGLVVELLRKMEICGSGSGSSWIGCRQKLCFDGNATCFPSERGYWQLTQNPDTRQNFGLPAPKLARLKHFQQLGSSNVQPAVRTIEAIVHSIQEPTSPF